jgi:predicted TIM-barrel fold metal-dependent hydrolase
VFPSLSIICGHIGFPWTQEMIGVAWKHPNVYIDTSARLPKYYPLVTVHPAVFQFNHLLTPLLFRN